jgi:hypothetical protein
MDTVQQEELSTGNCLDSSRAGSLRNGGFVADDFMRLKYGSHTDRLVAMPGAPVYPNDISGGPNEDFGGKSDRVNNDNSDLTTGYGRAMSGSGFNVRLPPETSLPPKAPDTAQLTIQNASGGTEQLTVDLPWTMTMSGQKDNSFVYLSAQGGQYTPYVTVTILVDGKTLQQAEAIGNYKIATASGRVQ